jgi:predicted phosphate transport protein (TIGR00153 family)
LTVCWAFGRSLYWNAVLPLDRPTGLLQADPGLQFRVREEGNNLRFFQALMPREEKFFALFDRHARTLVAGALALRDLLEGGNAIADASRRIIQHENEADIIARDVLLNVRRSFITPFDRVDIKELIELLDDSIDQMQKTAKVITLFEVTSFEPHMRQMADIILRCAELTVDAVGLLGSMRENAGRINAIAEEITRLEEQADELNDSGIKALYLTHRNGNAMQFVVGNEIYDHLEKVVDRFEDVANRISGIVIEQV